MAKKKLTLEDMLVPKDEIPYEVPENWCWVKLGNISKITMGQSPKGSSYNDEGIGEILINGPVEFGPTSFSRTIEKKWTTEPTKMCDKDDIIMCVRGSVGKLNIAGNSACIGRGVCAIKPFINEKYLLYVLNFKQDEISKMGTGTTFLNISSKDIYNISIPVPPLDEQERIVNRIEGLFDKVDRAAELVDEARDDFEKRRAAILERAFSGQLTKKWREENGVSDVDTVIESILTKRLTMIEDKIIKKDKLNNNISESEIVYDIPKDWRWIRLGILCRFIDYRGKTPSKTSSGVRLITAKNIKKGYISFEPEEFIAEEDYEGWMTRGIPNYGDVIFTTEAPLGNVAQLNIQGKYALAQRAITLPIIDGAYPEYLKYILMSQSMQKVINEQSTGTTVKGIKASKLKEIIIPLPSMKEQKEIIRILDSTLNNETKIEEVSNICEYIDVIKKSILAKAFRGELGSNDLNEESSIGLIKDMLNS